MHFADNTALHYFKKTPRSVNYDELKSAAYMGLVKAASKYDGENDFAPYAFCRMSGEIKDYLRSLAWGGRAKRIKIEFAEL